MGPVGWGRGPFMSTSQRSSRYASSAMFEMPPRLATGQVNVPNLGARVKVFDPAGTIAAEFGGPYKGTGTEVDRFVTPHGVSVDSSGAVYIAEVAANNLSRDGELPTDREVIGLRKWVPAAG